MHPLALAVLLLPSAIFAQWALQTSHTTSDLNSVSTASTTVAWASGSNGTILRTADAGSTWTVCTPIPQAKSLSLASIQAFDADTAVVLTSGKGDRSRVFRTADGCKTWQLVFTNPDDTGDFRSLHRITAKQIYLLGNPVDKKFALFLSQDGGLTWFIADDPGLNAEPDATIPEPTNAALTSVGPFLFFTPGGVDPPNLYGLSSKCTGVAAAPTCTTSWTHSAISPVPGAPQSQPVIAGTTSTSQSGTMSVHLVALYPVSGSASALTRVALSSDAGQSWQQLPTPLQGSFHALSYSSALRLFIAVGDSGSLRSSDSGKTWLPLPTSGTDTATRWSDVALPFAVGPEGRIGFLPAP